MSKQYLTTHTVDNAHITDIFAVATTPKAVISGSGSSTLHIHDSTDPSFPLKQSISDAHKLGCHHVCTSRTGNVAASAGFGGEVKVWTVDKDTGEWSLNGEITGPSAKPGEAWALALSEDGKYLATTTNDGRVNVWNIADENKPKIREYETGSPGSGSFGMCVDLSRDGKYTASGHQNGAVYIFNNDTGRVLYSLSGLAKPVRAVAFSPGNTRLAAAGDAGIIALYDMKHGEHIGNLTGHSSWITAVDWSDTGEFLLSGSMDGKVKVWSIERNACVATHSETDKALWTVKWLPKTVRSEMPNIGNLSSRQIIIISTLTDLPRSRIIQPSSTTYSINQPTLATKMPTTRRSIGGARGVPAKGQSTLLSFSNKVTKSVPKDTKNAIVSPAVAKVEVPEPTKEEELATAVIDEPETKEPEEEEVEEVEEEEVAPEVEAVPEKSEAELRAEQITDAQIKKYWKSIEGQWNSPRVHQEGLSLQEKVLRYFDVSSQYGPCVGMPRVKRWYRAERLGLNPPVEVLSVLLNEENKGSKKLETAHMDEILNSSTVGQ
ncbi:hypothetical protein G7Z17_g11060 [Cylindrodendrum hubeiense]|uniref:EML-like second beta-propeller domain-containing protein n=1 Tax=Cylindrodendrum hubeiense TaxID=595255 RepID=A0A9P5GWK6_9HYPO|nr:hypothetical protein G7Z17_g11060 [Cylindrodendrum hubeiense]